MVDQKIKSLDNITAVASDDYLLALTDESTSSGTLDKITKADFITDIISTDANNALEVGTDDNLKTKSTVTLQGNTFNGNSQLVQLNSTGKYPGLDGSLITNIQLTNIQLIIPEVTCSTAGATAEKAITLSGFVLTTGATIQVIFDNANTANVPTLNVNSTGAKAIYNEAGTAVSATNPAYFPAGSTVEFVYNGTNWIFKKNVVENYINGASWYRVWSDGWIEQGGKSATLTFSAYNTITLLKNYASTNYNIGLTGIYTTITHALNVVSQTVSNFVINNDRDTNAYWQAKGY